MKGQQGGTFVDDVWPIFRQFHLPTLIQGAYDPKSQVGQSQAVMMCSLSLEHAAAKPIQVFHRCMF